MTTSKQIPESVAVLLRHDGWLRRIARQLIDDVHLRDDAIQETWLTAWQKAPVAGAGQLSWLATVLRRSKQRLQRSAGRRSHHEEAAASSESIEAGALAEKEETRRQIAEAVLQLEEPYRAALVQRYYHDLSAGEIGRQLGLPVATVRTHLHRGLARLRRQLQSRYGNQWIAVVTPLAAGPGPGATAGLDKGSALLPSLPAAAPALLLVVAGAVTWWMLPSQSNAPAPVQSIAASRLPVERLSKQALGAPATLAPLPAQAHRSEQPLEPVAATADPGKPQPARILLNGQLIGLWPGVPWTETLVVRRLDESDGRILLSTPVTAAGHFEVDLSPFFLETGPSHVFLHGLDPAYAAFSKPVNLWIEGKPPQAPARIEVQVEVQPVGILSGEVRDPFGHPLAGAAVGFVARQGMRPSSDFQVTATTDDQGHYRLPVPAPQAGWLVAAAEDQAGRQWLPAAQFVEVQVAAHHQVSALTLSQGVSIAGLVTWSGGAACEDARLKISLLQQQPSGSLPMHDLRGQELFWWQDGFHASSRNTTTGRDGDFRVQGLARGLYQVAITGLADGPLPADLPRGTTAEVEAPVEDLHLQLEVLPWTLEVLANGEPVAFAGFTLSQEGLLICNTQQDGSATVFLEPQGMYQLEVMVPGFARYQEEILARHGRHTIQLLPELQAAELHLTLRDPTGQPLQQAWLQLTPLQGEEIRQPTRWLEAENGRYQLQSLPPGSYAISVRGGQGFGGIGGFHQEATAQVQLQEGGSTQLDLTLAQGGRIRFLVRDKRGDYVAASCTLIDATGEYLAVRFAAHNALGHWTISNRLSDVAAAETEPPLAPGIYRVVLEEEGFVSQEVELEVISGQTTECSLILQRN